MISGGKHLDLCNIIQHNLTSIQETYYLVDGI